MEWPGWEGFPSKNQFLKARVPAARSAARRDVARPDLRKEILGLLAAGLSLSDNYDCEHRAELLLERYDRERKISSPSS